MPENNNDNKISNDILSKIKSSEVKMVSRNFFFFKWLTLFITSIFFLGLAFYIFAYVTFLFVDNGLAYIPLFTTDGFTNFIIEIPWTLVFLGLLALFLFSITSKTFYKIYRKPLVTFFLTVLIIIMIAHIIFVESGIMKRVKEEAYNLHLQLVPNRLLEFRDSQTGTLVTGKIVGTTTNSVLILNRKNEIIEVFVNNDIDLNSFSTSTFINAYVIKSDEKLYAKSIESVE